MRYKIKYGIFTCFFSGMFLFVPCFGQNRTSEKKSTSATKLEETVTEDEKRILDGYTLFDMELAWKRKELMETLSLSENDDVDVLIYMFIVSFSNKLDIQALNKSIELTKIYKKTREGRPFIDFTVKTPTGKAALSDYVGKGKFTLVHFWAGWNRECIAEIPYLTDAYKKYRGQKLDVLGVAVWDDPESTQQAIEKYDIKWNQILNAKEKPVFLYGINNIPYTILFDPNGIILARDLKGKGIGEKLNEIFSEE